MVHVAGSGSDAQLVENEARHGDTWLVHAAVTWLVHEVFFFFFFFASVPGCCVSASNAAEPSATELRRVTSDARVVRLTGMISPTDVVSNRRQGLAKSNVVKHTPHG